MEQIKPTISMDLKKIMARPSQKADQNLREIRKTAENKKDQIPTRTHQTFID